jgi:hypothetical protein
VVDLVLLFFADGMSSTYPRTVQEIYENLSRRKDALRKALTVGEALPVVFLSLLPLQSRKHTGTNDLDFEARFHS